MALFHQKILNLHPLVVSQLPNRPTLEGAQATFLKSTEIKQKTLQEQAVGIVT